MSCHRVEGRHSTGYLGRLEFNLCIAGIESPRWQARYCLSGVGKCEFKRIFERDVGENQQNGLKARESQWNKVVRATVAAHQIVLVIAKVAFMLPIL